MTDTRRPLVAAAALAAVYLVWGSTYLAIAVAVRALPPFLMLSIRFLLAGGALYLWSVRRAGRRPTLREWRSALIVGGLLLFVDNGAVAWAEHRHLHTGLAALLTATIPVWLVGLDAVVSRRRLGVQTLGGIALGLLGVGLLVGPSTASLDVPAVVAILLGTVSWAAGSLYARSAPLPERTDLSTAMQMLCGGLLLGVTGAFTETHQVHPGHFTPSALAAVAYLAVFGSLVAFTAYGWLLKNLSTKVVATHAYVNPVVAVLLGWLVLGEAITPVTVLAGAFVVASVCLLGVEPKRVTRPVLRLVRTAPAVARQQFLRLAA
jgi:drug/metabolite transporter (DMT)-like permease